MSIKENVKKLMAELGPDILLVAAVKGRTPAEVNECVEAGANVIGQNYLKDAERAFEIIGDRATWHFIGRLQRNKIARIVRLFDVIETLDSLEMAEQIDRECASIGKIMPVLIEVNSGEEEQKNGVFPHEVMEFAKQVSVFENISITGLMTMGPLLAESEGYRRYFKSTRQAFDELKKAKLPRVQMLHLSMGMTDSYQIAIEEGANVVRIGSKIFGPRS